MQKHTLKRKQVTEMQNRITRRTEEERSNTMERKKLWAGLVAVAMALALSVGGASAYEQGDFAEGNTTNSGKLVPYYMAGDNLATIIGVENQSTPPDGSVGTVNVIEVRVLSAMGAVQAVGQLCMAQNQFGYAVLQEEMDGDDSMVVLMVGVGDATAKITGMPGDQTVTGVDGRAGSSKSTDTGDGTGIASMGYVVVSELGTFTTAAVPTPDTGDTDDGCDSQGSPIVPNDGDTGSAGAKFAAWAILQDVGEGSFFGTEIPAVSVAADENITATNADMDRVNATSCGTSGQCRGLVETTGQGTDTMVTARFDNSMANDTMSMIYVWMDNHVGFVSGSGVREKREVTTMVYCEGAASGKRMMVDLPDRINMIDGMDLGCDGRGVAMITLPDSGGTPAGPNGAVVWSHISQDGGGFRMNFTGVEDL